MHTSMHVHLLEGVIERERIGWSLAAAGQTHAAGDLDTRLREHCRLRLTAGRAGKWLTAGRAGKWLTAGRAGKWLTAGRPGNPDRRSAACW
ncbi:MAG TPA: hypothetical protein VN327_10065, partial [Pseudonocardiaceae bacterium]|nr:hypothetical protein [Pseudonocardiaceae bacterium]